MLSVCRTGQYLTKFNYNNNSSAVKFVILSISNDTLKWSDKQADIDDGASECTFLYKKTNSVKYVELCLVM